MPKNGWRLAAEFRLIERRLMKEGSVLLVALLLTLGVAYWSGLHPSPTVASVAPRPDVPEPGLAPPSLRAPATEARLPDVPGPDQAYRCTAGGSQTFSDMPCAAGERQEIIALRTPQPGTPTVSYAEQYRRLVAGRPAAPGVEPHTVIPRSDTENGKDAECKALMHVIDGIDASLRQPQGPAYIELLKSHRRSASDRRFSMGC